MNFSELEAFLREECAAKGLVLLKFEVHRVINGRVCINAVVEKKGYILTGIAECEIVNKLIKLWLKNANLLAQVSHVDVSVPGIDRELYSISDCVHFCGENVFVELKELIDGMRKIKGFIKSVDCDVITLVSNDSLIQLNWDDIKKIKVIPNWEEVMKRTK